MTIEEVYFGLPIGNILNLRSQNVYSCFGVFDLDSFIKCLTLLFDKEQLLSFLQIQNWQFFIEITYFVFAKHGLPIFVFKLL
jgi:hypothetical protein